MFDYMKKKFCLFKLEWKLEISIFENHLKHLIMRKKNFFFPFCIIKLEEKKKSLINWFKEEEKKTAYIIRSKVETNIKKKKILFGIINKLFLLFL